MQIYHRMIIDKRREWKAAHNTIWLSKTRPNSYITFLMIILLFDFLFLVKRKKTKILFSHAIYYSCQPFTKMLHEFGQFNQPNTQKKEFKEKKVDKGVNDSGGG